MQGTRASFIFASDRTRPAAAGRAALASALAVLALLAGAGGLLFWRLPDAGAFDARVERLFVENADLTSGAEVRLLEILAQSGTAFADTLASYRLVIFVLLVFGAALLVASLASLLVILAQGRRLAEVERAGIRVASLRIARGTGAVTINEVELQLTDAAVETLSALAEAAMDGEILSGAELEAVVTGKPAAECDETSGATRVKRLRDALGNQLVAALLVRTVARKGYVLAVDRGAIRIE